MRKSINQTSLLLCSTMHHHHHAFNSLRCNCPPGAHTHARGFDELGESKSARAAAYPKLMCECVVYGLTGVGPRPAILGEEPQEEVCSPGKPAATSCPAQCKCTEGEEKIIHFKYFFLD